MTLKFAPLKSTATVMALMIAGTAIVPVSTASAHDRHNNSRHFADGHHLNKKRHRQCHNRFGRGQNGTIAYRNHVNRHHAKKNRRNKKGDLIAAGVIGLAIGAIIASEASKNRRTEYTPNYRGNPPVRSGNDGYGYQESYYGNTQQPYVLNRQPVPLDNYNGGYSQPNYGEPNVVTFNDPANLQPWSQGWREWCQNRYRSFNANTGTFRGYDGLDHFCVPK